MGRMSSNRVAALMQPSAFWTFSMTKQHIVASSHLGLSVGPGDNSGQGLHVTKRLQLYLFFCPREANTGYDFRTYIT
jgi:NAD(P)H-hydrate repair Nnr-like enzyme with NAD(P)H-hydrate epimerase domain